MTIKSLDYVFSQTKYANIKELDDMRIKAILEQNYMFFKGLDDSIFTTLSEKAFNEAEAVTYKLIEEDNQDIYL